MSMNEFATKIYLHLNCPRFNELKYLLKSMHEKSNNISFIDFNIVDVSQKEKKLLFKRLNILSAILNSIFILLIHKVIPAQIRIIW